VRLILNAVDPGGVPLLRGIRAHCTGSYQLNDLNRFTLYDYPARMASKFQGDLLDGLAASGHAMRTLVDPFMGSGTMLVEAMLRGLDFVGQDINPLSVLVCKVLSGPCTPETFSVAASNVTAAAQADTGTAYAVALAGMAKWFGRSTAIRLSRLHRAISKEADEDNRRFLWVCFAETVRLTSRMRNTSYKLHMLSPTSLAERQVDVEATWKRITARNLERLGALRQELLAAGNLDGDSYAGRILLRHGDTSAGLPVFPKRPSTILVTSPSYGDNKTTIPYGQNSYLPLRWIDWTDIGQGLPSDLNGGPCILDGRSLGGRLAVDVSTAETLCIKSPALATVAHKLRDEPRDRMQRVFSFMRDFSGVLAHVDAQMAAGSMAIWTLGNRSVSSVEVPFDRVLPELSERQKVVVRARRQLPRKRQAARNATTATMTTETVLLNRFE
jgi:hypothetical protein